MTVAVRLGILVLVVCASWAWLKMVVLVGAWAEVTSWARLWIDSSCVDALESSWANLTIDLTLHLLVFTNIAGNLLADSLDITLESSSTEPDGDTISVGWMDGSSKTDIASWAVDLL